MINKPKNKGIILFDGYCNLCSWSVRFILKRDNQDYFRFAAMQSETGKQLLSTIDLPSNYDQSVILVVDSVVYTNSDAALRISKKLRHLWPVMYLFAIIPKYIRDKIYLLISKNRYKWFGKKSACFVPKKDYSYRFL